MCYVYLENNTKMHNIKHCKLVIFLHVRTTHKRECKILKFVMLPVTINRAGAIFCGDPMQNNEAGISHLKHT